MTEEWFKTWFDTKYYHQLYKHRDENEARQFIDALLHFLAPKGPSRFLDVACGKGRHAIQLRQRGFETTGIDLSTNCIDIANQSQCPGLTFHVQDIREPILGGPFDYALNLFTSLGYFDNREEHLDALRNIHAVLAEKGKFVIDFLNVHQVKEEFSEDSSASSDGVQFTINKRLKDGYIVKKIEVQDGDEKHDFFERVMAFTSDDLCEMLHETGFTVTQQFGNYRLEPLSVSEPRVIIIAQKN